MAEIKNKRLLEALKRVKVVIPAISLTPEEIVRRRKQEREEIKRYERRATIFTPGYEENHG